VEVDQQPGMTIDHRVDGAACPSGHHRKRVQRGFNEDDAEALSSAARRRRSLLANDEDMGAIEPAVALLVAEPSGEDPRVPDAGRVGARAPP
jgi:hypothetical protein